MAFTIEIDDRDWDVENTIRALILPAERQYVGRLTLDDSDAEVVFDADVQLQSLDGDRLTVWEWDEVTGDHTDVERVFDVADIRRIEFY